MDISTDELDKLLHKTLESSEFNNVLGSLTDTIRNNLGNFNDNDNNNNNGNNNNNETEKKNDTDDIFSKLCENLIDILGSYFMDSHGNNICEILSNINGNIEKNNKINIKLNETLINLSKNNRNIEI